MNLLEEVYQNVGVFPNMEECLNEGMKQCEVAGN